MNQEKQIEEMAFDLENHTCMSQFQAEIASRMLYNAGYRKQSEGEWEKRTFVIFDSAKVGYRCSECNTTWDAPTNYCPNCGAKMKGGAE